MSEQAVERKGNYAAEQLKAARARRGPTDPVKTEAYKQSKEKQNRILKAVADEARTVPQIAEMTGLTTQEVMWWIAALRKYDRIQDDGKRGDYLAYRKK